MMKFQLAALAAACLVAVVLGHGAMVQPRSRNSVDWKELPDNPHKGIHNTWQVRSKKSRRPAPPHPPSRGSKPGRLRLADGGRAGVKRGGLHCGGGLTRSFVRPRPHVVAVSPFFFFSCALRASGLQQPDGRAVQQRAGRLLVRALDRLPVVYVCVYACVRVLGAAVDSREYN